MGGLNDQTSAIFSGMWSALCTMLAPLLAIFLGATLGVTVTLVLENDLGDFPTISPLLVVILVPVTMLSDVFGFLLFLVLMGSIFSYWRSERRRCESFVLIVFLCWLHVFRYTVHEAEDIPIGCLVAVVSFVIMAGLYVSLRFGPYWWFLLREWFAENREEDTEEDEDRFKTIDLTVEDPPPTPQKDGAEGPFPRSGRLGPCGPSLPHHRTYGARIRRFSRCARSVDAPRSGSRGQGCAASTWGRHGAWR